VIPIALFASALAWWIYRSTSGLRAAGQPEQRQLARELAELKDHPDVETVSDRLRKISSDDR
jgi:hypothetical protein